MLNFASNLTKIPQEPKVYAVVLRNNKNGSHLCLLVDYCLEDAIDRVRADAYKKIGLREGENGFIIDSKPVMYDVKKIDDLFRGFTSTTVEAPPEAEEPAGSKNAVMRRIIEDGDRTLYEKKKGEFTASERKFIEQELKK